MPPQQQVEYDFLVIDLLGLDVLMRDPVQTAVVMTYHPFQSNRPGVLPTTAFLTTPQPSFLSAVPFPEVASVSEPVSEQGAFDARLHPAPGRQNQPVQQLASKKPQPDEETEDEPKVTLESKKLWNEFHKMGTEMVITKSGRQVNRLSVLSISHHSVA